MLGMIRNVIRSLVGQAAPLARELRYGWFGVVNALIFKINGVRCGRNFRVNGIIYIHNRGTIEIGDNVTINSGDRFNPVGGQTIARFIVYPGGTLRISHGAGISNSTIVVQSRVEIGERVMIGGSCNIWDTDFHSLDAAIRGTPEDRGASAPVHIGDSAFIGAHSILLKSTRIGARAIVGAGSVGSLTVADDQVYVRR